MNPTQNLKNNPSTHHNPPLNTLCLVSERVRSSHGSVFFHPTPTVTNPPHYSSAKSATLSYSDIANDHSFLIRGFPTPCHLPLSVSPAFPQENMIFPYPNLSTLALYLPNKVHMPRPGMAAKPLQNTTPATPMALSLLVLTTWARINEPITSCSPNMPCVL